MISSRFIFERTHLPILLTFVFSGCTSEIGSHSEAQNPKPQSTPGDLNTSQTNRPKALCAADRPAAATHMQRLTRYEYVNTLSDLLGSNVLGELEGGLMELPRDRIGKEFDRLSQDVTATHVRSYFNLAEAIGDYYANNRAARTALFPCLGNNDPGDACIVEFINAFVPLVYRRPLEHDDSDTLKKSYDLGRETDHATGVSYLMATAFSAPDFLFRIEVGDDVQPSGSLTDWELASRLSYFAWGRPPDEDLRNAAALGELSTPQGLEKQVNRLLAHRHAKAHLKHFYRQWLGLDHLSGIEGVPEHIIAKEQTAGLDSAMEEEMNRLLDYIIWEQNGSFADLMRTNVSFISSPSLAEIYDVPFPNSADTPVLLDESKRSGILTRLAFLGNAEATNLPIHRGAGIRINFLCNNLKLPDNIPDEEFAPPPFRPTDTTRDRVSKQTSRDACIGCHSLINSAGFAFENFDAVGRYRTHEAIFDSKNQMVNELPINATVDTEGELSETSIAGAVEYSRALADSQAANRCFSTRLYEFSMARKAAQDDSCGIQELTQTLLTKDGSILETMKRYTLLPEFRSLERGE